MLHLSCEEATRLIEQRQQRRLPLRDRLRLFLHMGICEACRKYEQFSLLAGKILGRPAEPPESQRLSDECKQRIIKSIHDAS
jgi:hypothetical protein